LLSDPFFHTCIFHHAKPPYLVGCEKLCMFAFFTPVCFAWKLWTFKTETNSSRNAALSNRAATPASSTLAVKAAGAFREYFKSLDRLLRIAALIVNPAYNLEVSPDQL